MPQTLAPRHASLFDQWMEERRRDPRAHGRDVGRRLGVAEAELIASAVGQEPGGQAVRAQRLRAEFREIIADLPALGAVKTMTRNEQAVIEKHGAFTDVDTKSQHGLVLGRDIDLRLFFAPWSSGFAVEDTISNGIRRSLQFFDRTGQSIHKVFVDGANAAYDELLARYRSDDQSTHERVEPATPPAAAKPDADIDVAAFRAAWDAMTDTHEFFGLLRRFGVTRTQGLRLAGDIRAKRIAPAAAEPVLQRVAGDSLPVMIFVGNPGVLQVVSGPIQRVARAGGWLNILDPGFNLHLRDEAVTEAWVVRKPTSDGMVTSLELFDAAGETVTLFFAYRKEGQAAAVAWEQLLHEVQG